MPTFDERLGIWFEFRRLVTGRGETPEDAKAAADKAEAALKAQAKSVPLTKRLIRRGLLSEAELRHVIGERK